MTTVQQATQAPLPFNPAAYDDNALMVAVGIMDDSASYLIVDRTKRGLAPVLFARAPGATYEDCLQTRSRKIVEEAVYEVIAMRFPDLEEIVTPTIVARTVSAIEAKHKVEIKDGDSYLAVTLKIPGLLAHIPETASFMTLPKIWDTSADAFATAASRALALLFDWS